MGSHLYYILIQKKVNILIIFLKLFLALNRTMLVMRLSGMLHEQQVIMKKQVVIKNRIKTGCYIRKRPPQMIRH